MKHISEELFMTYIYNEAGKEQKAFVLKHLDECEECRKIYEELTSTLNIVSNLPEPVPERLEQRLSSPFNVKTTAESEIMTPEELSEMLKVSLSTIYDLLSDLPYLNLAGQIRFRRSSIKNWLETREHNSRTRIENQIDNDFSFKLWRDVG